MTPDPTVTAVSELLDAAFRELQHDTGPQDIEYQHQRAALEKRFAAILRARSALADVGECAYCKGGTIGYRDVTGRVTWKPCHACNGTGKQPRPAAEAKCVSAGCSRDALPNAMLCQEHGDALPDPIRGSPAAHTAQVTEEEREAVDKAVELFTRAALSSPLEWEDMHRRIATLHRLASRAEPK